MVAVDGNVSSGVVVATITQSISPGEIVEFSNASLAALIARAIIFPAGILSESDYLIRFAVIIISILIFYLSKKNLVYPTVFSAIILASLNNYFV